MRIRRRSMRNAWKPRPTLAPPIEVVPAADGRCRCHGDAVEPTTAPPELSKCLAMAARCHSLSGSVVAVLVAGYQAGFLWVAAVGIYLLLRRDIDGVQMNEVYSIQRKIRHAAARGRTDSPACRSRRRTMRPCPEARSILSSHSSAMIESTCAKNLPAAHHRIAAGRPRRCKRSS